ncbi:MAG: NADH-quinone oxidoreductase subunit M [Pelagibacterales bacterium]|nr:NADH-quinone oxidoreductase subunit M [Pelagibacterales bacterium]|tara:strand:+ start:300 stop:1784 length:1485 start_codon:yes stop_codon:yes gene_type:complete
MTGWPILSLMIFIPVFGAIIISLIGGDEKTVFNNSRIVALWTSLVVLLLSILAWITIPSDGNFYFVEEIDFISSIGLSYRLGIDGISLVFILLSTFLIPLCILISWKSITYRVREYMILFLILETLMIGTFCALDLILFYIFFESLLIPMFLIIGIWGGPRRVYAAFKFFLYTLGGSVLFLIAIIVMANVVGTFDIRTLLYSKIPETIQLWLWPAFFASFAIKTPMWPFHTWLPDAHVEAPTAGSVILAGVLLKVGGYGFIRFSIPMLPYASEYYSLLVYVLSVIAIIYASLVALMQSDMKKLIAYASVAHMGFVTIGLFTFKQEGIDGAMTQMLSHGIVSAALFICVGVLYDRKHSRLISDYGGLVERMPKYALVFMIFLLASIGLPGTSGFIGEFLILISAYQVNVFLALGAGLGIILGACYMLWLYKRVIFGSLNKNKAGDILDIDLIEMLVFLPLIILVFWIGIYPESFISEFREPISNIINSLNDRIVR